MSEKLLEVKNLRTEFHTDKGKLVAVNDVSFYVGKEEIVGLVGESGSGKSVTSLSVLRLLPEQGNISAGEVLLEGKDLLKMNKKDIRNIRGGDIAMIFQDPMSSLNPVLRVGEQIMECTKLHLKYNNSQARKHAIDMIKRVGIPVPEDVMNRYPHQLSGGMSQRIMIAMAMSCNPKVLIADEPTTALDVTIQAQVMELMLELKEKNKIGILLITHDLGVVAEMCNRVMVMYCGRIVEMADVFSLFKNPLHPYTKGLIASVPKIGKNADVLPYIAGRVPDLSQMPKGCKFAPRCSEAMEKCYKEEPKLTNIDGNRQCRCHLIRERSEINE
ncbi:ABC transporter ATP-binding protein [Paramaledivibacter caminithermalis]|uniref:Peptide/nickel transport system ATP-binding protein n=1 Tax=Paramaledivibacter caminithermalis (strain DSM 15212 / CIP 107654 / DViRD3) TaxID=1121301 RepID=A0A1M6NQT1_PARC5|nr:ABC transporter ATP-binding protein [Paramaledivibacter caminithermalis]SHJ97976.1 peptide/nickel transport system ATP-binding protein [Paramaledivibacter caminithermalis DSM 15212]